MDNRRIRVGIIFGGKSSEHEVSLLSAKAVYESLDKQRYEPILIAIDKEGQWHLQQEEAYLLHADDPKKVRLDTALENVTIVPCRSGSGSVKGLSDRKTEIALDVAFPILHGLNGEDGTVQGLLKLSGIPFVGASVLGSAVGMDKDVMKRLLRDAKIATASFLTFCIHQRSKIVFEEVAQALGVPFFVKPANSGSSIGIAKVQSKAEFNDALNLAFSYDKKILIEEYIKAREIEASVIGNANPIVSLPGEVIAHDEFNSWDAKYVDDCCRFVIPVPLSKDLIQEVQELAVKTYQVLCCEGMARVDFFLTDEGKLLVNEINTIPGFTKLSVFPRLWQASGLKYSELIDQLIHYAFERHREESRLQTSFQSFTCIETAK